MASSVLDSTREQLESLPLWGKVAIGLVAVGTPSLAVWYHLSGRKRKSPLKEDWKRNVVYLYQFPPAKPIPNVSPFCLKLETWLRMSEIPYEVISSYRLRSLQGQLPFVELNGKEYSDSTLILRDLSAIFHKEEKGLTPEQIGAGRALEQMVDMVTFWSYCYVRYVEKTQELLDVLGLELPWYTRLLIRPSKIQGSMKQKLFHHGLGRHPRDEIINIGLDDLRALSKYLGLKQFFMGFKASRVDATIFGTLAQIVYIPIETPHGELIEKECQNLKQFCERMREKFWPDWEEVCKERATKKFD